MARPSKGMGRGAVALAITGGVVLLVAIAAVQVALKGDGGGDASSKSKPDAARAEAAYAPRKVAPNTAEPQTANGQTSTTGETTLSLPDGTQVKLPPTSRPVGVTLSRQTNSTDLGRPGMATTGSMRVLEFDAALDVDAFAPVVTIPAREAGDVAYATLQMARVSDTYANGEVVRQKALYLPVTPDANGNLSAADYLFGSTVPSPAGTKGSAMSAAAGAIRVGYVLTTFQDDFDWQEGPRLVRMVPDHSLPGRHPAEWDTDGKPPPVVNVVVLIHGHNEAEKSGVQRLTEAPEPWRAAYKRDVWTLLYKNYEEAFREQAPCTVFYEYIYPTYRPIFSDLISKTGRGERVTYSAMGGELAELLAADPLLAEQIKKDKDFNLFVVAHSQGGVMARAGIQPIYDGSLAEPARSALQRDLQKIVTWGSPHHGSGIWTMSYAFRFAPEHYMFRTEQFSSALNFAAPGLGTVAWGAQFVARREVLPRIASMAMDAPSIRDMLWDNMTGSLTLDSYFAYQTGKSKKGTEFDLTNGARLYSNALRQFNERDKIPNEKYAFLAGITSKSVVSDGKKSVDTLSIVLATGFGATLNRMLLSSAPAGASDGASTYDSETAKGISGDIILVGDIDHEEYYGAPMNGAFTQQGKARTTFDATFASPGADLRAKRCACATLQVETPKGDTVTPPAKLNVKATLKWPPEVDKKPGGRIDRTEVVLPLEGGRALGSLEWKDGAEGVANLSGSLDVSGLAVGPHQLTVRVWFFDGTMLQSDNATFIQRSPDPTKAPTASASKTAGSGQWVLKYTDVNVDIYEELFSFPGVACSGGTKATSTESGATTTQTGTCQITGALTANGTSKHTWSRPPDRLTPGQTVTGAVTASQSGQCTWKSSFTEDGCRNIAATGLIVMTADSLRGQTFRYADAMYNSGGTTLGVPGSGEQANAKSRPTSNFAWTVPARVGTNKSLLIKFSAASLQNTAKVATIFWYEWEGP